MDRLHNVIQTSTTTQYDPYNNATQITTQKGGNNYLIQQSTFYTDAAYVTQNLIHLVKTQQTSDASNANFSRKYFMTYTTEGHPFQRYEGLSASGVKLSEITYDSQGRAISNTTYNSAGAAMTGTVKYDESGSHQLTVRSTLNGKTNQKVYETYTGKLKSTTDENNNSTLFSYDDYGRLSSVTNPDGSAQNTAYLANLKTTTVTGKGTTVTTTLDSLGRVIQVDHPAGEDSVKYDYYFGDAVKTVEAALASGVCINPLA